MKLKLDADGHVIVQDGKPVYVHDDGKEVAFDAAATVAKISQLNGEARDHRVRAEKAEDGLKSFEGIENAADARKAIETMKNLDAKKLVDAGEVEKVKLEAIKAVEDKYAPVVEENNTLKGTLVKEKIGGSFSRSKFITDKLAIPSDIAEKAFSNHFKLEGEHVIAYDSDGKKIFSREKPGDVAGFDEAMEILVAQYPHRDSILKSTGASGGGAGGGDGKAKGGAKVMARAQFDTLAEPERRAHVTGGGTVTD